MFFYPNLAAAHAHTRDGADTVTFRALFREVVASLRAARAQRAASRRAVSPAPSPASQSCA